MCYTPGMEKRAWTDSEVEYLRNSASESFLRDMSEHLGRPVKMVRWKLSKLGLKAKDARTLGNGGRKVTVWTSDRMQQLREKASTHSAEELAKQLDVTVAQVRDALYRHEIPGRGVRRIHSEREIQKKVAVHVSRVRSKYPEDGPWECSRCSQSKPTSEFSRGELDRRCNTCIRDVHLTKFFLLTSAEYDAMFESQGGVCGICKHPETRLRKDGELFALAVDHDHSCCPGKRTCGKCVRGLLCWECNNILGKIEKREGMLEGIASYLA